MRNHSSFSSGLWWFINEAEQLKMSNLTLSQDSKTALLAFFNLYSIEPVAPRCEWALYQEAMEKTLNESYFEIKAINSKDGIPHQFHIDPLTDFKMIHETVEDARIELSNSGVFESIEFKYINELVEWMYHNDATPEQAYEHHSRFGGES